LPDLVGARRQTVLHTPSILDRCTEHAKGLFRQ
jgi:hypothetical protein